MSKPKSDELSHLVSIDVLPSSGLKLTLLKDEDNERTLAADLEVLSVETFKAELQFKRWRRDGIIVKGRIFAELTQECVVSLEAVKSKFTENFECTFLPEGSKLAKPRLNNEGEMVLDPEGDDIPDVFVGKALDAWEITVEQTLLALDPFPRSENLDVSQLVEQERVVPEEPKQSPFTVLKSLKIEN